MSSHDQAAELLEAYALDALEREETELVNAHLDEGCEGCEEEVSALRAVAARLPLAVPIVSAGAALKRRILAEVAATPAQSDPVPLDAGGGAGRGWLAALAAPWRPAHFSSMAASVAVLAVAGLLSWNIVLQNDVDDLDGENRVLLSSVAEVAQVQQEAEVALAEAQTEAASAQSRSEVLEARMTAFVSVVGTPEQERVPLAATSEAPAEAWGNLLVNARDGTFVIVTSGLDATQDGGYVMWVYGPDGAIPVAFFVVDDFGTGIGHGKIDGGVADARVTISPRVRRERGRADEPRQARAAQPVAPFPAASLPRPGAWL